MSELIQQNKIIEQELDAIKQAAKERAASGNQMRFKSSARRGVDSASLNPYYYDPDDNKPEVKGPRAVRRTK